MTARLAAIAALGLAGCALSSKSKPLELHYFSAEPPAAAAAAPASREPAATAPRLRLGPVTAADYLRFRIVHRDSAQQIDPYDTLRWTEAPREYVRRALGRALFDTGAVAQVIGGAAPVLDVEVTAFEQVTRPGGPGGRVELRYELRDDRMVVARGRVTAERPARGAGMDAVVAAVGAAMDAASAELAGRIVPGLHPPAEPGEPAQPRATGSVGRRADR